MAALPRPFRAYQAVPSFCHPFASLHRFFSLASQRRLNCCVRTKLFLTRVRKRARPCQKGGIPEVFYCQPPRENQHAGQSNWITKYCSRFRGLGLHLARPRYAFRSRPILCAGDTRRAADAARTMLHFHLRRSKGESAPQPLLYKSRRSSGRHTPKNSAIIDSAHQSRPKNQTFLARRR